MKKEGRPPSIVDQETTSKDRKESSTKVVFSYLWWRYQNADYTYKESSVLQVVCLLLVDPRSYFLLKEIVYVCGKGKACKDERN